MTVHHTNLVLRAGSQEKEVGKIVAYGTEPIFHAWGDRSWMRLDSAGWSVAEAVYRHCLSVGVTRFAIFDKTGNKTYLTDAVTLRDYGIITRPRKPSPWGPNRTLAERLWRTAPGKLPLAYVPSHIREVVAIGGEDGDPSQMDLLAALGEQR